MFKVIQHHSYHWEGWEAVSSGNPVYALSKKVSSFSASRLVKAVSSGNPVHALSKKVSSFSASRLVKVSGEKHEFLTLQGFHNISFRRHQIPLEGPPFFSEGYIYIYCSGIYKGVTSFKHYLFIMETTTIALIIKHCSVIPSIPFIHPSMGIPNDLTYVFTASVIE